VSTRRNVGLAALAAGVTGAAAAGAVATERRIVGRARNRPDPFADEPLGMLHSPAIEVLANDGVTLHVEVDGEPNAPLTVVFVHGFTLSMDSFHFQRRDLGDLGRLVFYDQRSHGRSGRSAPAHCTVDQLGADLYSVLQAVASNGPVVLVGHSLGGMTILALADSHPELFGDRVVGVAVMSTSTGNLARSVLGLPRWASVVVDPAAPRVARLIRNQAALIEKNRDLGTDFAFMATRYLSFGSDAPPSLVTFMEQMLSGTPVEVMSEFFDTFLDHDKLAALDVLRDVPVLISCGDRDRMTPASHSRIIAEVLPDAELQLIPGGGHMALIDRYPAVNAAVRRLVERATAPTRTAIAE
jgi:pimeloyl-ACP methyl ester carboxylesterase